MGSPKDLLEQYVGEVHTDAFIKGTPILEDIECDVCGAFICIAWNNDLNGSYFYCSKCVESAKAKKIVEGR